MNTIEELNKKIALETPADIDQTVGILQLSSGEINGEKFWAYLSMYPSLYQEYCAKVQLGEAVDLEAYGKVLEKGWGAEPPAEVVARMVEEYGIDMNFEEDMKAAMEEHLQANGRR